MSLFILNLDHKGPEIKPFLKSYGIPEFKDDLASSLLNTVYKRVIDTNVLKSNGVNYAVLNESAVRKNLHTTLKAYGILSFLRIDEGHLVAGVPKPIKEVAFEFAKKNGFVGVKIVTYIDNIDSIDMNINNLINYSYMAKRHGLLPIWDIRIRNEWEDKADREKAVFDVIFDKLHKVIFNLGIIFSMPENPGTFDDINRFEIVKFVAGSDFEQTMESAKDGLSNNQMSISFRKTILDGIKINMSDDRFKEQIVNNLTKLKE